MSRDKLKFTRIYSRYLFLDIFLVTDQIQLTVLWIRSEEQCMLFDPDPGRKRESGSGNAKVGEIPSDGDHTRCDKNQMR